MAVLVESGPRAGRNFGALGLIALSVSLYSVTPALFLLTGALGSPFLFVAFHRLGAVLATLGSAFLMFPGLFRDPASRASLFRVARSPATLLLALPYFSFNFFLWAARFAGAPLAAVVEGAWPLFFILFMDGLLRGEGRYRRPGLAALGLSAFSCAGVGLAVWGRGGGVAVSGWSTAAGVGLASLAALAISANSYNFRWAFRLRDSLSSLRGGVRNGRRLELFCLLWAFAVGSTFSFFVNLALGLAFPGSPVLGSLGWALLMGAAFDLAATSLNRLSNLVTTDLGTNALGAATPVLALLWLWAFRGLEPGQVVPVFAGAALVAVSNFFIAARRR